VPLAWSRRRDSNPQDLVTGEVRGLHTAAHLEHPCLERKHARALPLSYIRICQA